MKTKRYYSHTHTKNLSYRKPDFIDRHRPGVTSANDLKQIFFLIFFLIRKSHIKLIQTQLADKYGETFFRKKLSSNYSQTTSLIMTLSSNRFVNFQQQTVFFFLFFLTIESLMKSLRRHSSDKRKVMFFLNNSPRYSLNDEMKCSKQSLKKTFVKRFGIF